MNTTNQKVVNYLFFALLVFVTIVGCKNADSKMEETADEIENKAEEVKNDAEKMAKDVKVDVKSYTADADVMTMVQVDTPPLMDATCKTKEDPKKCSENKIMDFVSKNVVKPEGWNNEASLEQVLVVVEKDGSLRDIKYVASSNKEGCEACQKAAVEVVGKMDKWVPATKDGKPVAVKMTIPVKFI